MDDRLAARGSSGFDRRDATGLDDDRGGSCCRNCTTSAVTLSFPALRLSRSCTAEERGWLRERKRESARMCARR
jgi:hypothetical protein